MMTNRKYMRQVVIFIAILTALACLINYTFNMGITHAAKGDIGKVNNIAAHKTDPLIAIFGSSVGEAGIDPHVLTKRTYLSAYNYCMDGTRYMQYRGLIDEFAAHSSNNKYILFAESYFSFEPTDAIHSMELYMEHLDNDNIYNSLYAIQPALTWKCKYIPFYKYIAATDVYYKNVWSGWKTLLNDKATADTMLGFIPRTGTVRAGGTNHALPTYKSIVDSNVIKAYTETISSLQRKGRVVIIILPPVYKKLSVRLTDLTLVRRALYDAAAITHSTFWDFTTSDICVHSNYFYNAHHLNSTGAQVFTCALADSLSTLINRVK